MALTVFHPLPNQTDVPFERLVAQGHYENPAYLRAVVVGLPPSGAPSVKVGTLRVVSTTRFNFTFQNLPRNAHCTLFVFDIFTGKNKIVVFHTRRMRPEAAPGPKVSFPIQGQVVCSSDGSFTATGFSLDPDVTGDFDGHNGVGQSNSGVSNWDIDFGITEIGTYDLTVTDDSGLSTTVTGIVIDQSCSLTRTSKPAKKKK